MASLTSLQSTATLSSLARNALENQEDFTLWAEAVRQQMLDALQKRHRAV